MSKKRLLYLKKQIPTVLQEKNVRRSMSKKGIKEPSSRQFLVPNFNLFLYCFVLTVLQEAFNAYDVEKCGSIPTEVVGEILETLDVKLTEDELDDIIVSKSTFFHTIPFPLSLLCLVTGRI